MNRRDWLGTLGVSATGLAAGITLPQREAEAADAHDAGKGATSPIQQMHLYLCAFHIAKKNPRFQIEAHHYCSPVADEVHQCIIFDASGPHARILGVEYIISDRLYQELPDEEKKYYHPHAYEVLSGQLIAPGLSEAEEKKLFRGLITTWGKTWHTWPDPKTPLPMGEPILMWSINRDGQIDSTLLANRDRRLQVSSAEIRQARAAYGYEVPSVGPPKSVDEVGRRWTDNGPDVPRRK